MARRFTNYGAAEKLIGLLEQPTKDVQDLVSFMHDILRRVNMAKGCNANVNADNIDQIKANFEKLIHHHHGLARRMDANEPRTFCGDNETFENPTCGDYLAFREGAMRGMLFGLIFWALKKAFYSNLEVALVENILILGLYLRLMYSL